MKKILCCGLVMFLSVLVSFGQQATDSAKLMHALSALTETYSHTGKIGFDMQYRYTNEHTPLITLDSIRGSVEMDSTRYWCLLDSTETMTNDSYTVMLFKEDKIMYLSKAPSLKNNNPLKAFEQFLYANKGGVYKESINNQYKTVAITFPDSAMCRQLAFTVDTKTGFLTKTVYIISTSLLVDQSVRKSFDAGSNGYEKYARVETVYSNYRKLPEQSNRFDESNFFYKSGDEFVTTASFKEYKIFVASPNL